MNKKIEILKMIKESDVSLEAKIKIFNLVKDKNVDEIKESLLQENPEMVGAVAGGVIGYVGGTALGNALTRTIKNKRANCKRFKDSESQRQCRVKYDILGFTKGIALLQKERSTCKQSNNPKKCNERIDRQITWLKSRLSKAKAGLKKAPGFMKKHFEPTGLTGGDY